MSNGNQRPCAVWLRVSTTGQHEDNQEADMAAFCAHHGLDPVVTYRLSASAHKDNGEYSATLRQAQQDAHQGRFEVLVIWSLDRLSRRGISATLGILQDFAERGVTVLSVKEDFLRDNGPTRDLVISVLSWVAQWESQRRSERVRAGIARANKQRETGQLAARRGRGPDKQPRKRSGYVASWEMGGARRQATAG